MLSNSKIVFSDLAKALYRAAFYVSFADLSGGKKAMKDELQALTMVMKMLEDQSSEDSFLAEISKIASSDLKNMDKLPYLSPEEIEGIQEDLENVPKEISDATHLAIDNFSKSDARLYIDIVVSSMASIAQAHDEKDDMFLMSDPVANVANNVEQIFYRILMFFSKIHEDKNAKYLYNENSLFDQMKISQKETDAMGDICSTIREAWMEKYPDDAKQTVQEYLAEQELNKRT